MPRYRLIIAARKSVKTVKTGTGEQLRELGIETQDKYAREWAERQGHDVVETVADMKSGKVPPWDRPNLRPWVTEPDLLVQYDAILAFKNDRLSRGAPTDEARIRQWAEANHKVLIIVDGPQWPPRDDGDFWAWTAQAKQAHAEWEAIQERVVRAQVELKQRGKLVGRAPFGYTSIGPKYDRQLVPTDIGRKFVPEIFRRVIAGESLNDICKWLNEEGAPLSQPRKNGNGWWDWAVGKIIKNETYTGFRPQQYTDPNTGNRVRTFHRCEPLVDVGIFKLANEALKTRSKRGPSDPETQAMLKGAISCSYCGPDFPMYRIRTGGAAKKGRKALNKIIYYYRCAGKGNQRKGCGNMAPVILVDEAVGKIIHETFNVPVMIKRVVPGHDHSLELEALKLEMRQLAQIDMRDDEYEAQLAELRAERDRIDALPVVPGTLELVRTGENYAALWDSLRGGERGPWLRRHGFRVEASQDAVKVVQGDRWSKRPLV